MELIREIFVPTTNTYTLNLPNEMIGKKVEVIAFGIGESEQLIDSKDKLKELRESLKNMRIDLSGFKFDRDEANNYDE
jgi:hypothetical protein